MAREQSDQDQSTHGLLFVGLRSDRSASHRLGPGDSSARLVSLTGSQAPFLVLGLRFDVLGPPDHRGLLVSVPALGWGRLPRRRSGLIVRVRHVGDDSTAPRGARGSRCLSVSALPGRRCLRPSRPRWRLSNRGRNSGHGSSAPARCYAPSRFADRLRVIASTASRCIPRVTCEYRSKVIATLA